MTDWRDHILQHFAEPTHRLTLVADPDGLLLEEGLLAAIRARGFDLLPFEDPVAFRHAYESGYRQHWDETQPTDLVVILRSPQSSLQTLPYDLLQSGRTLHFSLPELFPKLSYPVVSALDPAHLQPLYATYQGYHGLEMGDRASKLFILKHVFGVVPELIKTPADLLKLLLARHVRAEVAPPMLDELLLEKLRQNSGFDDWPLEKLLHSAADFFAFLQERWRGFLAAQQPTVGHASSAAKEARADYASAEALPFADPEVRVYLNTLFIEGKLKPLSLPEGWQVEEWAQVGVKGRPNLEGALRFNHLLQHLAQALPDPDAPHKDWLHFAEGWAELVVLRHRHPEGLAEKDLNKFETLHLKVEARFARWMLDRYHTLHNQPHLPRPVMVHQVPHYLAACRREGTASRLALVVVDGLALDQWHVIREVWAEEEQPWSVQGGSLFAWAPTLTPISRQATFAGVAPQFFPVSWQTTNQESARWSRFWAEHGLPAAAAGYARNLGTKDVAGAAADPVVQPGTEDPLEPEVLTLIEDDRLQVVGLVVNTVDNIGHGMQLGTAGMHQQIRLWLTHDRYLTRLVARLLAENFTVFLTSDHGNVWTRGLGRPNEGVLVETRGQRARVYTDPAFLASARQQFQSGADLLSAEAGKLPAPPIEVMEWTNVGLPEGVHVLLASGLNAFLNAGEQAICHGGIALEEVIVPFIEINKLRRS
ncbi:MAG: BREX-3 system phosphatase PglZ [Anaerolineae bacterium]